jgi:glycosyltransferase involved in cell wall biosynthesis
MNYPVVHITTVAISLHGLLLNQLLYLREAGYDIDTISTDGPEVEALNREGIKHIAITIHREITPFKDLVSLWQLYRVLRREDYVIVHTHTPKPGLIGQLAARFAGVPIVINTIHGYYFHENMHPLKRGLYITVEKIAALCSDVILSQNKEDIELSIREKICSPEKIKHLGNGIDLSVFDPERITPDFAAQKRNELGLAEGVKVVGFVGRLAAVRKGFLDFLKAGQIVAQHIPEVRFLIVGRPDTGKHDAVEPSVAEEYGIQDKCIFLGWKPNDELPGLYAVMDVIVLPSLYEGFPRTIMEASAMKVPAVVTDVKGNREAVIHNRNGLLVPLGDVDALAGAIMDVLTDQDKALQMGEEGRRIAKEQFDEQLVFRMVKEEYARLLKEKGLSEA